MIRLIASWILLFLLGALSGFDTASASSTNLGDQLHKLTALDPATDDEFGCAVATANGIAVIGALFDDDLAFGTGSIYVFDARTGEQLRKITAPDAARGDMFGYAIAMEGTTAIVGAPGDDPHGSVYVIDISTGNQLMKLVPTDDLPVNFGTAVSIDGNIAVVGDYHAGDGTGTAYLFDITTGQQLFQLAADDSTSVFFFGVSVAISGNTVVVGARGSGQDGIQYGAAYVFDVTDGRQVRKLTASDRARDDAFGWSVTLNGTIAVIGAIGDDDFGDMSGSAYVFDVANGAQLRKLTATDAHQSDQFGYSVQLDGGAVMVGAITKNDLHGYPAGATYLFDATDGTQLAKFTASDGTDFDIFGCSVALKNDFAIVGARGDDDGGSGAGSAYAFDATYASPVPVKLSRFTVERRRGGALLAWDVTDVADHQGFHVYRDDRRSRLTEQLLTGHEHYEFLDTSAPEGAMEYWLAEISRAGATTWHGPVSLYPAEEVQPRLVLGPAQPNPFRMQATIPFQTRSDGAVILQVLNLAGHEVARLVDAVLPAGDHISTWTARDTANRPLPAGIYFVRLSTLEGTSSTRLVKLR